MAKKGYVYILTNKRRTVLYVGVTSEIEKRIWKHKTKFYPNSFSAQYNVYRLVYFEEFNSMVEAIAREKQLKAGPRRKKEALVNSTNPEWKELTP